MATSPACSRPTTTGSASSAPATRPGSSSTPSACRRCRPAGRGAYVLRAFGYCKDADPFTATSDTIEPLAMAGHARLPVRCRCHPACHGGSRRLSPRVPDAPGGWSRAARGSTLRASRQIRLAGHWSRGKHGNQTALLEAVIRPGWGDRTMLEPRVDISRVDQVGGRGGLEPDEALAADQRVGSRPSDQQGMTEPAMLPGRAGPRLESRCGRHGRHRA